MFENLILEFQFHEDEYEERDDGFFERCRCRPRLYKAEEPENAVDEYCLY